MFYFFFRVCIILQQSKNYFFFINRNRIELTWVISHKESVKLQFEIFPSTTLANSFCKNLNFPFKSWKLEHLSPTLFTTSGEKEGWKIREAKFEKTMSANKRKPKPSSNITEKRKPHFCGFFFFFFSREIEFDLALDLRTGVDGAIG